MQQGTKLGQAVSGGNGTGWAATTVSAERGILKMPHSSVRGGVGGAKGWQAEVDGSFDRSYANIIAVCCHREEKKHD